MGHAKPLAIAAAVMIAAVVSPGPSAAQDAPGGHYHPRGNPPSPHTVEANRHQRDVLPMADKKDFDEAKRGFIAAPEYRQIKGKGGDAAEPMAEVGRIGDEQKSGAARLDAIQAELTLMLMSVPNLPHGREHHSRQGRHGGPPPLPSTGLRR